MVAASKVLRFVCGRLCRSKIERQDGEEMVADSKILRFVCGRSYRNEVGRWLVKRWLSSAFRMRQII